MQLSTTKGVMTIYLKGIKSKPTQVKLLGSELIIPIKEVGKISWSYVPGTYFIEVPLEAMDPMICVLQLQFTEPLQLYRGKGGFH
jgi:hypothetical protein